MGLGISEEMVSPDTDLAAKEEKRWNGQKLSISSSHLPKEGVVAGGPAGRGSAGSLPGPVPQKVEVLAVEVEQVREPPI